MRTKLIAVMVALALIGSAEARETKQSLWNVSYVCYEHGEASSVGCRIVTAGSERGARKQFHKEVFGETCKITAVERNGYAGGDTDDYWRFRKWFARLVTMAPRYGLKLSGDAADEEFFYLYCWQSDDHSIPRAVAKAKRVWGKRMGG